MKKITLTLSITIFALLFFIKCSAQVNESNYTNTSYTIVTDSCQLSKVPIVWSFTDTVIIARAFLSDTTQTFTAFGVVRSYVSEDDEYMTVLSYDTLLDRISLLFDKTRKKFIAVDSNIYPPGYFFPVKNN